jgi:hypothetical protein
MRRAVERLGVTPPALTLKAFADYVVRYS